MSSKKNSPNNTELLNKKRQKNSLENTEYLQNLNKKQKLEKNTIYTLFRFYYVTSAI